MLQPVRHPSDAFGHQIPFPAGFLSRDNCERIFIISYLRIRTRVNEHRRPGGRGSRDRQSGYAEVTA